MPHHRHNSQTRSAAAARTATSIRVTSANALPLGGEEAHFVPRVGAYLARVNLYGRTMDGVGETREAALAEAKARCERFK